jgi:hypothetical protein
MINGDWRIQNGCAVAECWRTLLFLLHSALFILHYSLIVSSLLHRRQAVAGKMSNENWKMKNGSTAITMRPGVIGSISQ